MSEENRTASTGIPGETPAVIEDESGVRIASGNAATPPVVWLVWIAAITLALVAWIPTHAGH